MSDENYIRNLRKTLDARISANEEQTRKENRETDIIKAEAPKSWASLKAWIKEATDQLNKGSGPELVTLVANGNPDEIKLRCNIETPRVDTTIAFFGLFGGQITATVKRKTGDDDVVFECGMDGGRACWFETKYPLDWLSIEDMGQKILDAAVGA